MTFQTEKKEQNSNRFMLVRIAPARCLNTLLVLTSGVYQYTFSGINLKEIKRNGTAITSTAADPPTVNDTYNYNTSTGVLKIKLASAPSSTNVIVLFHYIYLTGEKTRYLPRDPDNLTSTVIEWRALIDKYPTLRYTADNITAGILTIGQTSLQVIDDDKYVSQYLGDYDSFNNKSMDIWLCINDTSALNRAYQGKIKSVSYSNNMVTFQIFDPFAKLQQTAYMGDTSDECYYYKTATSFQFINERDNGKPCPIIFTVSKNEVSSLDLYSNSPTYTCRQVRDGAKAMNTFYSSSISVNVNRQWNLCRITGSLTNQTFGTIVRSYAENIGGPGFEIGVKHYYVSGHNIKIGETVIGTNGATTLYGICLRNDDYTISGNTYNLMVNDLNLATLATAFTPHKAPAVFVKRENYGLIPIRYLRDYTFGEVTTSGGNKDIYIQFVLNFEANATNITNTGFLVYDFAAGGALNPDSDEVLYIVYRSDTITHGGAIKKLLEASGISTNAASFTAADSALSANAVFQIPEDDENEYSDYRSYCQKLLASTFGYLKINSSAEAAYYLFSAPTSPYIFDDSIYLNKSLSIDIDYNDVTTELVALNPYYKLPDDWPVTGNPTVTVKSDVAKYTHETEKSVQYKHFLDRIDNRIQKILDVLSNRRARYSFKTASENLDSIIGDNLRLESSKLLGSDTYRQLKITEINKTGSSADVVADDLLGL